MTVYLTWDARNAGIPLPLTEKEDAMGKSIFESMYLPLPSPVQQMKERGNLEEA